MRRFTGPAQRHRGWRTRLTRRDLVIGVGVSSVILAVFVLGPVVALIAAGTALVFGCALVWVRGAVRGGLDRVGGPVLHRALLGCSSVALGLGLLSTQDPSAVPPAQAQEQMPVGQADSPVGNAPASTPSTQPGSVSTVRADEPTTAASVVDDELAPGARASSSLPEDDRVGYVLSLPESERPVAGSGVAVGVQVPVSPAVGSQGPGSTSTSPAATTPATSSATAVPTPTPATPGSTTAAPTAPATSPATVTQAPTEPTTTGAAPTDGEAGSAPGQSEPSADSARGSWLDDRQGQQQSTAPPAAPSTGVEEIVTSLSDG